MAGPDAASMQTDLNNALNTYGQAVRIRIYSGSIATGDYDDASTITQSGSDIWTSGISFSARPKWGSAEAVLMEQGKLLTDDKVLYLNGSVDLSGKFVKVGLGSPAVEHFMLDTGVQGAGIGGSQVYKKIYIRRLLGGSFFGE